MQSLNSVGFARKSLLTTGIGMFIAFLFLVPFAAFAAGSVTVTTDKSSYAGTATITVSGTVTPAPGVSGTSVAVKIAGPSGSTVDANQFLISASTGTYSGTFVTGGPSYASNGTYTITATAPSGASATATFQYGSNVTSSQTGGSTTTTVVEQITTTVVQQGATTTVVQQGATTTVVQQAATTTTVVQQGGTTTVSSIITSATTDGTALAIGALGVIIAIVAIVMAVLAMRKK